MKRRWLGSAQGPGAVSSRLFRFPPAEEGRRKLVFSPVAEKLPSGKGLRLVNLIVSDGPLGARNDNCREKAVNLFTQE